MILTYKTTSIDIGCAQYPYGRTTELIQTREKSASGVIHTEDFSVQSDTLSYSFSDMDKAEYLLLMDFFINVVLGMFYEFELTDDRGDKFTVTFTSPKLDFTEAFLDLYSGNFMVEQVT